MDFDFLSIDYYTILTFESPQKSLKFIKSKVLKTYHKWTLYVLNLNGFLTKFYA